MEKGNPVYRKFTNRFQARELLCSSLQPLDPSATRIVISEGSRTFKSTLEEHERTMQDESLLFSVGLLTSYALTESFARIKLSIPENADLPGGIEAWGTSFLQRTSHDWAYVVDGLQGIIEVSVARNFAAHGTAIVTQSTINRFTNLGLQCPWPKGGSITMDCATLDTYRARLRSFMRFGDKMRLRPK